MDKVTLEDILLADGEEVPEAVTCPACDGVRQAFEMISQDGGYICSTCYLTNLRETEAATQASLVESIRDTWQGLNGDAVRARRNQLLDQWEWTLRPSSPLSASCREEFATLFHTLHRLTIDNAQPSDVEWDSITIPTLVYED
jgi:hypothetical protein